MHRRFRLYSRLLGFIQGMGTAVGDRIADYRNVHLHSLPATWKFLGPSAMCTTHPNSSSVSLSSLFLLLVMTCSCLVTLAAVTLIYVCLWFRCVGCRDVAIHASFVPLNAAAPPPPPPPRLPSCCCTTALLFSLHSYIQSCCHNSPSCTCYCLCTPTTVA